MFEVMHSDEPFGLIRLCKGVQDELALKRNLLFRRTGSCQFELKGVGTNEPVAGIAFSCCCEESVHRRVVVARLYQSLDEAKRHPGFVIGGHQGLADGAGRRLADSNETSRVTQLAGYPGC